MADIIFKRIGTINRNGSVPGELRIGQLRWPTIERGGHYTFVRKGEYQLLMTHKIRHSHHSHVHSDVRCLCFFDDPVIRSVVRQALQRHGCHDVVLAHGGAEALDLCSGRRFDLLICDYQMRPMNGLDFLRELTNLGLGEGWPVIVLSAETDPATIQ